MLPLTIIVAATRNNGIGQNSRLPWRLPKEMKYFAQMTSNAPEGKRNAVVMGRNTWESIPGKFRPLPHRFNIVVSHKRDYDLGSSEACLDHDLTSAFVRIQSSQPGDLPIHRTFIIGGATLYAETLALSSSGHAFVDRILLTRVFEPEFQCDVFMPGFIGQEGNDSGGQKWRRASHQELNAWAGFDVLEGTQEENGIKYEFQMWTREP
ncbi:hypothetical protein AX17_000355 [Amanita inopinata Kibby_2008]|nr:hypothetical protein AX17_000355 [Amanita inopinata Kibby_2008]